MFLMFPDLSITVIVSKYTDIKAKLLTQWTKQTVSFKFNALWMNESGVYIMSQNFIIAPKCNKHMVKIFIIFLFLPFYYSKFFLSEPLPPLILQTDGHFIHPLNEWITTYFTRYRRQSAAVVQISSHQSRHHHLVLWSPYLWCHCNHHHLYPFLLFQKMVRDRIQLARVLILRIASDHNLIH